MKKYFWAVALCACMMPLGADAQTFTNDRTRERNFLREVKVIDEFIERFNDDPASFIRQEYKKAQRPFPLTRAELINTLFNQENQSLTGNIGKDKFLRQVTDSAHPQRLSFDKDNWFAEAHCIFSYNRQEIKLTLILQVKTDSSKASRWMIANIAGSTGVFDGSTATRALPEQADTKGRYFISPSSCATNFLELHQVLKSGMNPANFFVPAQLSDPAVIKVVDLIQNNKLTFSRVDDVRFYFYQIPNYVFTVEQFTRAASNSGWLINELEYVTDTEKEERKRSLLQ